MRGEKLVRAREMRRAPMPAEALLWAQLRRRRPPFRRQQIIAGFIVDFVSLGARLIIEVDGGVHDGRASYDAERDRVLSAATDAVIANAEAVAFSIIDSIEGFR